MHIILIYAWHVTYSVYIFQHDVFIYLHNELYILDLTAKPRPGVLICECDVTFHI